MTDNTARYLKEAATAMAEFGPEFNVVYRWDTVSIEFTLTEIKDEDRERQIEGAITWEGLAVLGYNPLTFALREAKERLKAKPWW